MATETVMAGYLAKLDNFTLLTSFFERHSLVRSIWQELDQQGPINLANRSGLPYPPESLEDEGRTISRAMRGTVAHFLDDDWLNASTETKKSIRILLESLLKKSVNPTTGESVLNKVDLARLTHVKNAVDNPWDWDILNTLLVGKPGFSFKDYLQLESARTCYQRVQVLVSQGLLKLAQKLTKSATNYGLRREQANSKDRAIYRQLFFLQMDVTLRLKQTSELEVMLVKTPENLLLELVKHFDPDLPKSIPCLRHPKAPPVLRYPEEIFELLIIGGFNNVLEDLYNISSIDTLVPAWIRRDKLRPKKPDGEKRKNPFLESLKFLTRSEPFYATARALMTAHEPQIKMETETEKVEPSHGFRYFVEIVECFVRGLTIDQNKIELNKFKKLEEETLAEERNMSVILLELATVFHACHPLLHREVILTAFSLKPEKAIYEMVVEAAKRSDPEDFEQNVKNTEEDTPMETDLSYRDMKAPTDGEFDTICNAFVSSLETGFGKSTMDRGAKVKYAKNLVGILSIEGNSLTNAPHYDPSVHPFKAFQTDEFKDHETLLSDLLIVLNSPRWHLLSWLFDWATLSERCQALLGNPKIKTISDELKYLVIDYTQFDEWSSDEDLDANTGIEKGYEKWELFSSDDEDAGEAKISKKSSSDEAKDKEEIKKESEAEAVDEVKEEVAMAVDS